MDILLGVYVIVAVLIFAISMVTSAEADTERDRHDAQVGLAVFLVWPIALVWFVIRWILRTTSA